MPLPCSGVVATKNFVPTDCVDIFAIAVIRCPGPANVCARRSSHSSRNLLSLLYPSTSNSYRTRFRRSRCSPTRRNPGSSFPSPGRATFSRGGVTDVFSHNLRKTFATRLLSRGAAITDVQHLLGHASVKTTEKAYAAFVKNERFKQTIDLLDKPAMPKLKVVI